MHLQKPLNLVGVDCVLLELKDVDIRGISVEELTDDTTISWIWKGAGIDPREQNNINDTLRIAWCKARAITKRKSEALMWEKRAEQAKKVREVGDSEQLAEGRVAYAKRQAVIRRRIKDHYEAGWAEALEKVRSR
ncbi:hypothetical protein GYMLUDRAFT_250770 [Collybiopsis luxurians FD-317 M1]|uniref:Uncharacterized protein n=1 Tax=Collybiopsis luxurians FD-317 M1 TaxID=944289 RepID=A0A0D0BTP3_9AGAR|nr:hypothetical protein GYMLUDRAFT_250770 [Collybiopsis luxurians FD-317 M1]